MENDIDSFAVIGDAETCAVELIRTKWKPDLTMREFAELSYSIIRYIEERNISAAVGFGSNKPPVRYLSDVGNIDTELTNEEWGQFKETYEIYAENFDRIASPYCQHLILKKSYDMIQR